MDVTSVRPGAGIGDVRLRSSPEAIRQQLGEPDHTWDLRNREEWEYEDRDLIVVFAGEGADKHVVAVESSSDDARIRGRTLDRPKDDLLRILSAEGWGQGRWRRDRREEAVTFSNGVRITYANGAWHDVSVIVPGRESAFGPDDPDRRYAPRRIGCAAAFFAVLSAFSFYIVIQQHSEIERMRSWPATTATVIRVNTDRSHDQTRYWGDLAFIDRARPRTAIGRIDDTIRAGDRVRIRYSPDSEEVAVEGVAQTKAATYRVFAIIEAIVCAALVVWLVVRLRSARPEKTT